MAVGQAIALATNTNPTKIVGSDKLLPRLQQMLDGFRKADPPTTKQLPVEADVPEYLVTSEVVLCPILYCIDVFSTYPGKILDFVVVHWSFIFVSHVSRLIVEFI
jgi:hypothetical protein